MDESEVNIFGEGLTDADKKAVRSFLQGEKERGKEKIEGELEKTEDEVRMIGLIGELLKKEMTSLGIETKPQITPEQIHFLPEEQFRELYPDAKEYTYAYGEHLNQAIYLRSEKVRSSKTKCFYSLLHEIIENQIYHAYHADPKKKDIGIFRSGYRAVNVFRQEEEHEHFHGLKEGVVDTLADKIISNNLDEITEMLDVSAEDIKKTDYFYESEMIVLGKIVSKIAREEAIPESEVRDEFFRGLFTGNMSYLKKIDRIFGKGSLRILNLLQPTILEETYELVEKYFNSDSGEEREAIKKELGVGKNASAPKSKID